MARLTKPWSPIECDYLKKYIRADFETGLLYWKEDSPNGKYKAGDRLKSSLVGIPGVKYYAFPVPGLLPEKKYKSFKVHHVVWFLATGKQSELYLDHINHDRLDNRLSNLREVTTRQNQQNQAGRKNKMNGVTMKGVNMVTRKNDNAVFQSVIGFEGVLLYVGTYPTEQEAAKAYDRASIVLHGQYGCRNFPDHTHTPEEIEQTRTRLRDQFDRKKAALNTLKI